MFRRIEDTFLILIHFVLRKENFTINWKDYLLERKGYVLSQGYYNQSQEQSKDPSPESSHDMQVQVTGTTGISWRKKLSNVSEEDLKPEGGRMGEIIITGTF